LGEGHVGANLAVGVEQRFGGKAAELEAAAQAFDGVALGVGVAAGDPFDALGGHVAGDVVVHFHEDETAVAAVFGVLLEYGVAGCAGTRKAVENHRVFVGGDLQNALDQAGGFWRDEDIIRVSEINEFKQLPLALLSMPDISVRPEAHRYNALFYFRQKYLRGGNIVSISSPPNSPVGVHPFQLVFRNTPIRAFWWPWNDTP